MSMNMQTHCTGTAIVEYITRQGKRLSQEWNVDSYEEDEKDKPEFIGRTVKVHTLTVVLTRYTVEL